MKNILLIEDDESHLARWVDELDIYGYKDPTCAKTVEQALIQLPQKLWDAVAVDGCIGGDNFNSPPLIAQIKTVVSFNCPIIAASRSPELAKLMLQAGCTHAVRMKDHVPGFIHSILRRQ
jgi:DNA-binding NtrC family response regulator